MTKLIRHKLSSAFVAAMLLLMLPCLVFGQKPAKAGSAPFLKSLIIPGWGQYALGQKNAALAFFGTDIILLGGALACQSYGVSTRDDYRAFAAAHAGVQGDHGHGFYVDVGNWMTVEQFNEQRLRDRQFDALYTSASDAWSWDSIDNRDKLKKMRIKSDKSFNGIYYFAGGMILNHLASALHAGRVAATRHKQASLLSTDNLKYNFTPLTQSKGLIFSITKTF
jgi:hypothetical protein